MSGARLFAMMRMVVLAAGRGSRLAAATGGRSKLLLEVGGRTLLDRLIELGDAMGAAPLVVTRPEHAAGLLDAGVEVLLEDAPSGLLQTLYHARGWVPGTFCWMTGDLLFCDPEPLCKLVAEHLAAGPYASFLCCRGDRFKLKLAPGAAPDDRPTVEVTRRPGYTWSVPNFLVHSPAAFADLAEEPRVDYLQRAVERGEPVLWREYTGGVFEIDTPEDLAAARRQVLEPGEPVEPMEPAEPVESTEAGGPDWLSRS
jgi:NDP-sugar pyrophosphorylase family protein